MDEVAPGTVLQGTGTWVLKHPAGRVMDFYSVFLILWPATLLMAIVGFVWGLTTSGDIYGSAHLDRSFGIQTATPARRLSGYLLDSVLLVITLFIGWVIWFAVVAPRGQTPGKSLLSTYVMREDGSVAGGWYMWGREFLVKMVLYWFVNGITAGLAWTVSALWCLWDDDRQCLWDKIMSSYVAHSDYGRPRAVGRALVGAADTRYSSRLRELQQLRADGLITAEEYEERRQRLSELDS